MFARTINLFAVFLAALLLAMVIVSLAEHAHAQECPVSAPVEAGKKASCTGIIFPHTWAIQAVNCMDVDLPMHKEKHNLCELLSRQARESHERKAQAYREHIRELSGVAREGAGGQRMWHESKLLWFGLGIASASTLFFLAR